ncbi:MAG: hypothetical protein IAI50_02735 [Candidatus Eremiobacteraeota bacterium]|nr:hypothetical protein [Candidatus Eremiobacteraeota bacterium]
MQYQWAAVVAYSMVVVVFLGDWFSPAPVVVDVAYAAPVAFAALKGTSRLTTLTVLLGLFGIVLGWFVDLAQASFQFSDVRIENRLLSALSLMIVGVLSIVIQRSARREAWLDSQRARQNGNAFSAAVDRIMSTISLGTTVEAITGEASRIMGAGAAVWCSIQRDGRVVAATDGAWDAKAVFVHPSESFDSLLRRLASKRSVETVNASESIDFLLGKSAGAEKALALPIGHSATNSAILFIALQGADVDDATLIAAYNFARFASNAIQQAEKFAELSAHVNSAGRMPSAGR